MKQLLLICAVVALVGCLREVETEGQDVKDEPSIPEGNELPPEPPTNTPVQPKTEPKAEVKKPLTKEESAKVIEAAIRKELKKPEGELTKADLEKVTYLRLYKKQLTVVPKGLENLTKLETLLLDSNQLTSVKGLEKLTQLTTLNLGRNQLTDVKGLEKLTQLKYLKLFDNPDLTKAQIDQLQKALPNCKILSNPTK